MSYQKILNSAGEENTSVIKKTIQLEEGVEVLYIPIDESNYDYQEYLKWVALGNTIQEPEQIEPTAEQIEFTALDEKEKRMAYGRRTVALVSLINDSIEGLTAQDYITMITDPQMATAAGLLEKGALETARDLIAATNWNYWSAQQVNKIITFINAYPGGL